MRHLALTLALVASPAVADVGHATREVILPGFARFAEAADDLAAAAADDCTAGALLPAYQDAFDAWMTVADLRLGPSETAALSVAFWPDDRGFTPRQLSTLIAAEDPVVADPDAFAEVSVAARGLFALDMLLGDADLSGYGTDSYTCALVQAVATDLARTAAALEAGWADYAGVLESAGATGNATFLAEDEAVRAIYTQIVSGLEFTADTRLGRPMGTFERPRPTRAEAWRTDRPVRDVVLASEAAVALAHALVGGELPATDAALARVRQAAERVGDPSLQDLDDPQARLLVEVLQQAVRSLKAAIEGEVGAPLGIAPGFNSTDGD
ncbi:imelysin family protein [Wenxinia marina]|uniref:Putative periplasmic lipoprotein n=1 Tax=Wenxinia marina DSM 24838 TaxID=1123501 RepID=A0A0D0PH20_9RHOB|nr:imelysin family protein [Wenxinia marina]KIQ70631.1 putative periplasmic lipoprotein [Wenxinia marina DSM 24838]GGL51601.1 signal peptidase [Wenxinia marina]